MRSAFLLSLLLGITTASPDDIPLDDQSFLDALGVQPSPCDLDSECVPYYLCEEGNVITDGANLIDIRFNSRQTGAETTVNQHSECGDQYINVCCRDPLKQKPENPDVGIIGPVDPGNPGENLKQPYQPVCGRRNPFGINARIFGIEDVESQFGEFPWMAAILRLKEDKLLFVCGATLIHPKVLVTAAHCVASDQGGPFQGLVVRLGEWDTQHTTEFYPHYDADVYQVIIHENYNHARRNLHNDIALLILGEEVTLQEHIDTLCLPDPANPPVIGSNCVATGWGKDSFENGQHQTVLKQVTLPLVDRLSCESYMRKTRLGYRFQLDQSFICAGGTGADTCTGDGGSPLACPDPANPEHYVLGGIVSWGIGCGTIDVPGVYVDVTYFANWINANVATVLL